MPYGGNDWLALTQEPTLEPELPICDPHHHFWDRRLQCLPYQRYLLDELHADISSGHNVRSTVFLEARRCTARTGRWTCVPSGRWIRPGAGGGECQRDLRPQPSGRRHHRPCRLEARGAARRSWTRYRRRAPTGFGASGTTSPGVPTPRWTTGRARASWPTRPSGKGRRSCATRGYPWIS